MPLCGTQLAYEQLKLEEYMKVILADKPEQAKNDDFLDKLYNRIYEETN